MKRAALVIMISCAFMLLAGDSLAPAGAFAEEKKPEEKYMTRSEAAKLISATDFLKNKIGALLSWSIGYDISAVNRAKLVPTIKYIQATPIKVPPDGRTVLSLLVAVDDPGGLNDISGVRADLSTIGQSTNTALVDNGLWGDARAADGIYTIQTNVKINVEYGEKEIAVAVANKKGWLTLSRASLNVEKNPIIIWAKATPPNARADGSSKVLLQVAVENPGRIEDVKGVKINLSSIGGKEEAFLRNTGTGGDVKAKDNIFSLEITVPRGIYEGEKKLPGSVTNVIGGQAQFEMDLVVTK